MTISKEKGTTFAISSAGTDISFGNITSAIAGIKESSKVTSWKYGGVESSSNLSTTNMLSYSNLMNDIDLAGQLWSGEKVIEYVDFAGSQIGGHEGDVIYISKDLLGSDDRELGAQRASLASHENAHIEERDEFIARMTGYETWNSLKEVFELDGNKYADLTDINTNATLYKEFGEEALFELLFNAGVFDDDSLGKYIKVPESAGWGQSEYKDICPLGQGMTKKEVDDYNEEEMKKAYERYRQEEYEKEVAANPQTDKEFKDFNAPIAEANFNEEQYKKYGYEKAVYDDLGMTGCTLSTIVYIYYTLTGNLMSLTEANSQVAKGKKFVVLYNNGKPTNGGQKNGLPRGEAYADVVNFLAGIKLIEYANSSSTDDWSADIIKDFLNNLAESEDYFLIHGRTNTALSSNTNRHSVLVTGFTYDDKGNKTGVRILDPWKGTGETRKFSDFYRLDAYRVTKNGMVFRTCKKEAWFNRYR